MKMRNEHAHGFSLVELMIALVCTMIISGAIYGLLSGGQSAFRREPELTDRQQNIRLAMDIIMRDVTAAGASMPAFMQTFTTGLDGATLATGTCIDNDGNTVTCPVGPGGDPTDELEIMSNTSGRSVEASCHYAGSESHLKMVSGFSDVKMGDVVMVLLDSGRWTLREITADPTFNNSAASECAAGATHTQAPFTNGGDTSGFNQGGGICAGTAVPSSSDCVSCLNKDKSGALLPGNACCEPSGPGNCMVQGFLSAELVRYRIRYGQDGVPNLERFSSGRASNFASSGRPLYQVIARGIDDLQVVYTPARGGDPVPNAPVVGQTNADFANLTQTVTVTLSSRSEAQNVAGVRTAVSGPTALRGSLTSSGSPRAVLATLGMPVNDRDASWAGGIVPSGQPTPWF